MIIIDVECDDCHATYIIDHDLSEESYAIEYCSFCGGGDIQTEVTEEE